MSSNEQSPRLHPSTMDAFYQQQVHAGSSFDRFSASYQNPAMTFPGFPQTSYNNFIPSRQSSNTLPSIGNFADPLSYLPYPSHLGSSHSTDRREPLPEFSSIVSSMSEGVPKIFPYHTQDPQTKRHNSSIPNSLAHPYVTHVGLPQTDTIDHSEISPSPSPALSQTRHPVQKAYTSQQYSQHPTNYSRYSDMSSHRLHSESEITYAAPPSVSPHSEVNRYSTPTNLSMSASNEHKFDSYKNIPSSFPREPYPLQTSDADDDRLVEKLKHPKKARKRLSHPKPVKKDKPFVAFNLLGKLEMNKSKSALSIESRDIAIQTDKSLMINDLNIATLKRRIYNNPAAPDTIKEASKEKKEETQTDNKPDKPFNILSTDDIDEYQNQKSKPIKETRSEAISETTEDTEINKTKSNKIDDVQSKMPKVRGSALQNGEAPKNFTPKVPLPELGNLAPGMINSLPLAAFKGKDKDAEMERMEINVRIDDSQYVSVDDGPKRWKCNQCPKSYTTKHNLVTHVMDHNGIKPHLCMICGKYFKQLSHLNTHMLTHENIKPNICPICGKGFTQVSHVKRHQAVHTENKPHVCDVCNRGFSYPSELRIHKQRQHIPGKEKCPECDEVFDSIKQLKDHLASHEQREDHECPECNKLFRYPSQLKDHLSSHSGHRPFICSECGMDFIKEHHLKAHAFTHTGLRPYECPQCGRTFNQRANMIRHQLIHSNDRAYKCDECDKSFTQPQTLKAHMVVHAEKKPHQCHLCGKEFGRQHNLQAHMHMHSDSKPFLCFCGSSFTLKGNLKRHKKVKHGIDDSTESMEEEAVSFLSTMSSRANHGLTINVPPEDQHESSPETGLLSPDSRLQRKQRKSIPRKIPQPDSDSVEEEEDQVEDEEKDIDKVEEDSNQGSRFFTALNHPRSSGKLLAMKRSFATSHDSDEAEDEDDDEDEGDTESIGKPPKKIRKESVTTEGSDNEDDYTRKYEKKSRKKSLTTDASEEEDEEGEDEVDRENDSDWIPKHIRPRVTKGKKLASVLAEKFSRSNLNK